MTIIPQHILHAGQQLYVFTGLTESPDGELLVRWDCVYCGGGDYVLSALPRPVQADELIGSIEAAGSPEPLAPVAPVPEPGSAWLLAAALAIAGLRRWL